MPRSSSLAVLPFENGTRDPDSEYLSDGITESLIDQMSRVQALRVMARATVFRFKGSTDPQEAGRKLGVGAVLTGKISRREGRLSISAELMDVATGARLWGETFDRPSTDLLRVQNEIASDISAGLRLRLTEPEKRVLGRHGTENPEAYELFLKARYAESTDTEEGYLQARQLFLLAVTKDPSFARAQLGVSDTYGLMTMDGYIPPAEGFASMDEGARKALALDPDLAEARAALVFPRFLFPLGLGRSGTGVPGAERRVGVDRREGASLRPPPLGEWPDRRGARGDREGAAGRPRQPELDDRHGRLSRKGRAARGCDRPLPSRHGTRPLGPARTVRPGRDPEAPGRRDGRDRRSSQSVRAFRGGRRREGARHGRTRRRTTRTRRSRWRGSGSTTWRPSRRNGTSLRSSSRGSRRRWGRRRRRSRHLDAAFAERSPGLVLLKVDTAWDRIRDDPRFAALVRRVGIP